MSVQSEITRLQNAKTALKTAIEGKGVTVPSNTLLNDYAQKVNLIEQGGGGSSSSDEWLYYSATGVKVIQSGFMDTFLDCSNTSNLIVERIVSDGSFSCHYGTWWADWQISDKPFASSYVDAWFRIKPNNMSVGDTGTLTINLLNRTCIITFKLTETFSEEQMYYQGTDIQKLEIVSAPYIVNPLNGADLGNSSRNGGTYQHQYQISNGSIINARLFKFTFSNQYTAVDNTIAESSNYKEVEFIDFYGGYGSVLQITTNGLLSLILSQISQNWQKEYNPYGVILTTDNNVNLIDYFTPYVWWTCFIKDTNIILVNRAEKKIQDITYDDELLVWNFDEGKYDSAKPLWIKKAQTTTWYYRLTFSDGTVLKVTGDYPKAHSLYSVDDGKFIHANELVGKKVYTLNGIQILEKCEEIHEEVEFYNIITYHHMNLYAEDVLTSCRYSNLYPIEDMRYVKDGRTIRPQSEYNVEDKYYYGLRLGESQIELDKTLRYINNLKYFEKK